MLFTAPKSNGKKYRHFGIFRPSLNNRQALEHRLLLDLLARQLRFQQGFRRSIIGEMSHQRNDSNDAVIDFTDPNTPPAVEGTEEEPDVSNSKSHRRPHPEGSNTAINFQSPSSAQFNVINTPNNQTAVIAAAKWTAQVVYLRIMGRKQGPSNNELNLVKPYKTAPINYSIMGLFSKESSEVRYFTPFT